MTVTSTSTLTDIDKTYLSPNESNDRIKNSATRQVLETVQRLVAHQPYIVVTDYGADPTGTKSSTTAIANAINALPVTGGWVMFPAGTYLLNSGLQIGTGTTTQLSTLGGVYLCGAGFPSNSIIDAFGNGNGTAPLGGVTLQASTSFSTTAAMVSFNNVAGWGVNNICFSTPSKTAGTGLSITSCSLGNCQNLSFDGFSQQSIFIGVQLFTTSAGGLGDSFHNTFTNTVFTVPDIANAAAVVLTGDSIVTNDTAYCNFINNTVTLYGNVHTTNGFVLKVCDTNMFVNSHIINAGGNVNNNPIVFDYSINGGFPGANFFYMTDYGAMTPATVSSSAITSAAVNQFIGIASANGSVPPFGVANVSWVSNDSIRTDHFYTAAQLPSAANNQGMRALGAGLSTSPTFGTTITTGGSGGNLMPVFSDGNNWRFG